MLNRREMLSSRSGPLDVVVVAAETGAGDPIAEAVLGNGLEYINLAKSADAWIEFQFRATAIGAVGVRVLYAMSAASGGDVRLQVDLGVFGDGDDPTAALIAGTPFVVTPGNDTNLHTADETASTELRIAVAAGDLVRVRLTRTDHADDTHTADMRVLQLSVTPL